MCSGKCSRIWRYCRGRRTRRSRQTSSSRWKLHIVASYTVWVQFVALFVSRTWSALSLPDLIRIHILIVGFPNPIESGSNPDPQLWSWENTIFLVGGAMFWVARCMFHNSNGILFMRGLPVSNSFFLFKLHCSTRCWQVFLPVLRIRYQEHWLERFPDSLFNLFSRQAHAIQKNILAVTDAILRASNTGAWVQLS